MKVYFVYEGEGDGVIAGGALGREAYKVKITIPASWLSGPCAKLRSFFCTTYNKKFADKALAEEDVFLKCGGVVLPLADEVQKHVQEYNDILILHHPPAKEVVRAPEGSLLCTNFGCGKRFLPDENNDTACSHHKGAPVFHDTYKYWSCCPDKKALDWEEFDVLPRCVVGPHSTANKPVEFKSEPLTAKALTDEQKAAMDAGATEAEALSGARRTCGPRVFEGARDHEKPQEIKDGKATCRNFGCQQVFVVAENTPTSCTFHAEGPVFHDAYKYWKCCPGKKCDSFDDFVAVPGCVVGPHKL